VGEPRVLDGEHDSGKTLAQVAHELQRELGLEQALADHRARREIDDQRAVAADRRAFDACVMCELGDVRRPSRGHDHDDDSLRTRVADRLPAALRDGAVATEKGAV
jgi:hypothetical protein